MPDFSGGNDGVMPMAGERVERTAANSAAFHSAAFHRGHEREAFPR